MAEDEGELSHGGETLACYMRRSERRDGGARHWPAFYRLLDAAVERISRQGVSTAPGKHAGTSAIVRWTPGEFTVGVIAQPDKLARYVNPATGALRVADSSFAIGFLELEEVSGPSPADGDAPITRTLERMKARRTTERPSEKRKAQVELIYRRKV